MLAVHLRLLNPRRPSMQTCTHILHYTHPRIDNVQAMPFVIRRAVGWTHAIAAAAVGCIPSNVPTLVELIPRFYSPLLPEE